jgi:hypothetical protein
MNHPSIQVISGIYRVATPEQTYQRVLPLMDIIQAGPIVDLTDYDMLSIPAYKIRISDYTVYGKGVDCLLSNHCC